MKKLFTLFVAICATTLAWADDSGSCGENVTYSFVESTGTLTISGTGAMKDNTLDAGIPTSPWDYLRSAITTVVIEDGVANIGKYAFAGCSVLTNITIPNSVTNIGEEAFTGCTGLTSVTIPNSITSIGTYAFAGCKGLTSVTIPNSVTSIGEYAFHGCTGLTSITIPNSVTSIGNWAFSSVKHIVYTGEATGSPWGAVVVNGFVDGDFVFYDDKKTQLATDIGNGGNVTIPNSVISIGSSAFQSCTGLTNVTIPNSVTSIGSSAFQGCTGLTNVTIPNSVTTIGSSAFQDCTGLTNVTIPNSVTSIGDDPFYNCNKLAYNTYSNGKYLGNDSNPYLYLCNTTGTDITNCKINENCKLIGNYAFSGCTELTSITIPNSVTSIGRGVFYRCTGLASMIVEATTPPLCINKYGAALNMPNYNIPLYVQAGSVDAYKAADEWKNFTNIQAIPATGVNEATAEKSEVKKIMIDGTVYIEAKDMRYNLNGQKVK